MIARQMEKVKKVFCRLGTGTLIQQLLLHL